MATSSERSPPPFPDSEDQELESEDVQVHDSDDDGDDLFLSASDPQKDTMNTVPPADDIVGIQPNISTEPPIDIISNPLSKPAAQTDVEQVSQVIDEATSDPSDEFVELMNDDDKPPSAVPAESAASGPVKDTSEMALDEPPEDLSNEPNSQTETELAGEIASEPSDDFVDLLGNEIEEPVEETAEKDVPIEATSAEVGSISEPLIDDTPGSGEQEPVVASSCPVVDVSDELLDLMEPPVVESLVDPLVNVSSALAAAPKEMDIFSDLLDISPSVSDTVLEPVVDVVSESLPAAQEENIPSDLLDEAAPPVSEAIVEPVVDVISAPPSATQEVNISSDLLDETKPLVSETSFEPVIDVISAPQPASEEVNISSALLDEAEPPVSEAIVEPVVDVVSASLPADQEVNISSDLLDEGKPAVSEAVLEPVVDVISASQEMKSSSDLLDEAEPPVSGTIVEPVVDVVTVVKKNPETPLDLFEDEPSELFMEPRQAKSAKPLQTSLFGEPDEDLFSEPLGAKSVVNEPKDKSAATKSTVVSGPLSEDFREDPTDIFTEEAVGTTPSVVNATIVNSETNGVHSEEEEPDIFAEATVELSLDSPRNDRKKTAAAKPAASVPALSAAASTSKPPAATLEELEEDEQEDKFELNISITNPEKIGDGMNAYMAYKVSTQTTLPMFRSKTFTVRRRFSDFLGLYEKLSEKHSHNGFIVPPPPEKSILGMSKVKMGKEDPSSAEFVERRRAALERYLQRVVCHPSLLQDPDVREFLERDELPRAVNTQALSGAGFLKMISKATEAVSKMTIKMNESDVWFEEKLQEVEAEDQQFRKLLGMVDSLVGHRKELSLNTASFAKSIAMLGSSEDNTALSRALSQLAEVEDKMEQLHQEQASNDSFNFAELLADYIRLLGSVRASFDHRMKSWQRWQDAQNMLQKKRETEAKLLWANKPDKLQQAKEDIAEWEAKVSQYERDFDRVSATVRKEVLRFEKEKARDFKRQIMKYLDSLLQSQQQVMKYWETFLPEAKAIA